MADQLYLSLTLRGFTAANMLRHYERMLKLFPYSKLSTNASVLRIQAVSSMEPLLYEAAFDSPPDVDQALKACKEFAGPDCAFHLDAYWDLWQYTADWEVRPARVSLSCFGPAYESSDGDHLRIEFGIDTHFLPQPDLPQSSFMAQSNVRSLLHLVHQLDNALAIEARRLWTESGDNFADRLRAAVEPGEVERMN